MFLSSTVSVTEFMVVVEPLTVRLPATVRSFSTTTSELNVVSTSTVNPLESLVLIVLPTNSNTVLYVYTVPAKTG